MTDFQSLQQRSVLPFNEAILLWPVWRGVVQVVTRNLFTTYQERYIAQSLDDPIDLKHLFMLSLQTTLAPLQKLEVVCGF